jgi:hypothetical protein
MKIIEPILSCLTSITMVDDLRQVLREKDPEFLPAEEKFLEAVAHLTEKLGIEEVERYVTAMDRQICSDLVYAGYLGFQVNLQNFHNPVANQFTRLDYETFLREHIMQTLPYRTAAEDTERAFLQAHKEILSEYEEGILDYYVHLEITGPKLAHFWGYRFANQFLPWVEPGYVSDGAQTSLYALELNRDLGFSVS